VLASGKRFIRLSEEPQPAPRRMARLSFIGVFFQPKTGLEMPASQPAPACCLAPGCSRKRLLAKGHSKGTFQVPSGRVKWFDQKKGYGFIVPDDGSRDLFVHITAVQKAGYTDLVQGLRVTYEIRPDREGNPTAESLRFG
jgi:cold shock protein